jgi:hypothetical protein
MGMPTGEVVARPLVARACGCLREFQHFAKDKYREQRLALFRKTRCEDCVAKLNEEQKRVAAGLPKVGSVFRSLPAGAQVTMTRRADGAWAGTLTANEVSVEGAASGPQELTALLARLWATARGGGEAKPG